MRKSSENETDVGIHGKLSNSVFSSSENQVFFSKKKIGMQTPQLQGGGSTLVKILISSADRPQEPLYVGVGFLEPWND